MRLGLGRLSSTQSRPRFHSWARFCAVCQVRKPAKSASRPKDTTQLPKAKKSYGQNFLREGSTAWEIVNGAQLIPGMHVLEIGPGTGCLTHEILQRDVKLVAIENDHALMEGLQTRFQQEIASGQFKLLQGDATRIDLQQLLLPATSGDQRWKVVANLPFNITTEILKILLPMSSLISDVYVMLQVEAAMRIAGHSQGDSDYRAMSAQVEFYSQATPLMVVPRTNFQPQPNVDCQMVNFRLKQAAERLEVPSEKAFLQVLKVAFSSRRKTVQNNLKAVFPASAVSDALRTLDLDARVRPQELSASEFAALSRILLA